MSLLPNSLKKNLKGAADVAKGGLEAAAGATKDGFGSISNTVTNSGTGKVLISKAGGLARSADDLAERTGAKAAAGAVGERLSDGLDSISGEKLMREMQRRLDGQDELNDALATRLHEALTRIEALERRLAVNGGLV